MSCEEYSKFSRTVHSLQAEMALELIDSLWVGKTLNLWPEHVSRMIDGKHHELEVQINRYIQEADLKDDH